MTQGEALFFSATFGFIMLLGAMVSSETECPTVSRVFLLLGFLFVTPPLMTVLITAVLG